MEDPLDKEVRALSKESRDHILHTVRSNLQLIRSRAEMARESIDEDKRQRHLRMIDEDVKFLDTKLRGILFGIDMHI